MWNYLPGKKFHLPGKMFHDMLSVGPQLQNGWGPLFCVSAPSSHTD